MAALFCVGSLMIFTSCSDDDDNYSDPNKQIEEQLKKKQKNRFRFRKRFFVDDFYSHSIVPVGFGVTS